MTVDDCPPASSILATSTLSTISAYHFLLGSVRAYVSVCVSITWAAGKSQVVLSASARDMDGESEFFFTPYVT